MAMVIILAPLPKPITSVILSRDNIIFNASLSLPYCTVTPQRHLSTPPHRPLTPFCCHLRPLPVSIVGSLRDREVACSASDRQGSNFESCVWRTVSSQSSHHPQEVLLAQFSLYVHKGGLKPDSFHLRPLRRTTCHMAHPRPL